jgi:hypothetical protein
VGKYADVFESCHIKVLKREVFKSDQQEKLLQKQENSRRPLILSIAGFFDEHHHKL